MKASGSPGEPGHREDKDRPLGPLGVLAPQVYAGWSSSPLPQNVPRGGGGPVCVSAVCALRNPGQAHLLNPALPASARAGPGASERAGLLPSGNARPPERGDAAPHE